MKSLLTAVLVAGGLAMLPRPTPADAQSTLSGCVGEAIGSCDADFEGDSFYMVSIRGYCYMIRSAICYTLDPR